MELELEPSNSFLTPLLTCFPIPELSWFSLCAHHHHVLQRPLDFRRVFLSEPTSDNHFLPLLNHHGLRRSDKRRSPSRHDCWRVWSSRLDWLALRMLGLDRRLP